MPREFFHRHNIHATTYKPESETVAQRVPRHPQILDLRHAIANPAFKSTNGFAGLGIVENDFVLPTQEPSLRNLCCKEPPQKCRHGKNANIA
jgi:hypothetical protein